MLWGMDVLTDQNAQKLPPSSALMRGLVAIGTTVLTSAARVASW
jgi:hypothetical protein